MLDFCRKLTDLFLVLDLETHNEHFELLDFEEKANSGEIWNPNSYVVPWQTKIG